MSMTVLSGTGSQLSSSAEMKLASYRHEIFVGARALTEGATRLIAFTAMGAERILRSIGIHAHRIAPPQLIDDKPALALWIELDENTCRSLGMVWEDPNVLSH